MHVLTLTEPLPLGKTLGVLPAGEWVVTDQNAFEMGNMAARGTATVSYLSKYPSKPLEDDDRPDLIMRSGAIGDLLMLTPALTEWRVLRGQRVNLCCFPHHFPLFDGNPDVDTIISYPLALQIVPRFRRIISLENTMECDNTRHPTDIFRDALGVTGTGYKPIYRAKASEKLATSQHLFHARPNIALQLKASVANRDYPLPHWLQVISGLEKRGWGVLLLGAKGQIPPMPPNMRTPFTKDLSALGLTIRESAAVLAQCDAFIGIDSAFVHFAHALDIPAIGLFGPFLGDTRVKALRTTWINGDGECRGCGWHIHNGRSFPPNKPCTKLGRCVVLESIRPERIIAKAELLKP